MSPNWIKLLYDRRLILSDFERKQLRQLVEVGEIDREHLEITLITLIIRAEREINPNNSSITNTIEFPTFSKHAPPQKILSLWGGHESQWLSDTLLLSSIVIATLDAKVLLSPYPKARQNYWRASLKKLGINSELPNEMEHWRSICCGWMSEKAPLPNDENYQLMQIFSNMSGDYHNILYSGLLNKSVNFIHMMVPHKRDIVSAADLLSALNVEKGLVFSSELLRLGANENGTKIEEISYSEIGCCTWSLEHFGLSCVDKNKDFYQQNKAGDNLIAVLLAGELNHRFGLGVIIHAATALYSYNRYENLCDATKAVIQSLTSKKPKQLLDKLLSFNRTDTGRRAN